MADAFKFEIQGAKELERMLEQLPKTMGRAVLRKALRKAAAPIQDAVAANVPRGPTGNLAKSIIVSGKLKSSQKKFHKKDSSAVEVFIGSTAPHAHLVEFGTVERYLPGPTVADIGDGVKTVTATGRMTAQPFFRQAWDATKGRAYRILVEEIRVELLKSASRLAKKAERGTLGKRQKEALR